RGPASSAVESHCPFLLKRRHTFRCSGRPRAELLKFSPDPAFIRPHKNELRTHLARRIVPRCRLLAGLHGGSSKTHFLAVVGVPRAPGPPGLPAVCSGGSLGDLAQAQDPPVRSCPGRLSGKGGVGKLAG